MDKDGIDPLREFNYQSDALPKYLVCTPIFSIKVAIAVVS